MHHRKRAVMLLVALSMLLGTAGPPAPVTAAQGATPTVDCPATTPEENLAVVRSFFEEGVNRADLSVFDRVAAPDVDPLTTAAGCYVRVADADALYREWHAVGVESDPATGSRLVGPTTTDYGMREFALVDPSGNLLRIGSKASGQSSATS